VLRVVQETYARTIDLERGMDPSSAQTIHRTRVAFKKFRYMVEALQPLLTGITPTLIAAMHDYQSMMGDVQDTDEFLKRVDKYARGDAKRARELARFRHWLLRRRTSQITFCLKHSDRLRGFWPLPQYKNNKDHKPLAGRHHVRRSVSVS
jgi:CHAD domain-containing protein